MSNLALPEAESMTKVSDDPFQAVIGDFGRWQKYLSVLFVFNAVSYHWQVLSYKFLTYPVDFECVDFALSPDLDYKLPTEISEAEHRCGRIVNQSYFPCVQWKYDETLFQVKIIQILKFN